MPLAVVTGAAGFLGSNLCRGLVEAGWEVVGLDNLLTGRLENVEDLFTTGAFTYVDYDVTHYVHVPGPVDAVLHFASPASPRDYLEHPIKTLKVGSLGTHRTLGLAKEKRAVYLLASTSEVYGDPLVHPQPESYWGNVNPVGPRGVYDEAKRFSEAMAMAYHRAHGLDVKIVRIFNTYGPGLRPGDGRAIPNFLSQALDGRPITIFGDGRQTRSFCYVDDQVRGIMALLGSAWIGPVNIGNPDEHTVRELAVTVLEVTGADCELVFEPLPADDPARRRPDISLAERVLGWRPETGLREGLARTLEWYRGERERDRA
ncbi:MAG: SDR family oxidoreductase [Acidimicrobiia bacterium]|nr:SDR family oxidoreductase [Acidimicrobiia bacterium]